MKKNFGAPNWREYIPEPILDEHPEYNELYNKAWELAYDHIKDIPGMPQTPYMDEAFCATQLWIWDTCFMSLFCKYARDIFPGVETFNNFYNVLYEGGHFPKILPPGNEPDWTGAVPGEPFEIKLHIADNPPLFAWAEYENAMMHGDKEYLKELLNDRKILQKHYDWFESIKEPIKMDTWANETCLIAEENGYKWEGGRSGMDNTPRGREGDSTEIARPNNPNMYWIDAICQQALSAKMISKMYTIIGDSENASLWQKKFDEKKKIVNDLYWDEKDNFYYDIDCNTHDFYKVKTTASYWTMTAEAATEEQARAMSEEVSNPETFGGKVPLLSLARNDGDYSPKGKYWRGALWLPTAYASLKGLINYGYFDTAHEAGVKIVDHMYRTFKEFEPHTIWECYNPTEPKPATDAYFEKFVRKDFCGWSALGPISVYIENVLGFHTVNAFEKTVKWALPKEFKGNVGIKNFRFADVVTDIVFDGEKITVTSNNPYTLEVDGKKLDVKAGENIF